jgi:hypothetical protein
MAQVPEDVVRVTDVDVLADPNIQAVQLGEPDFVGIEPKNGNVAFRWVNRAFEANYQKFIAMGFIPAVPSDCKHVPPHLVRDGHIVMNDLILMKIDRAKYLGKLKANAERALRVTRREEHLRAGQAEIMQNIPNEYRSKVSPFIPSEREIETLGGK